MTATISGLYGLFQLDDGPIAAADPVMMGLTVDGPRGAALAAGIDQQAPAAVHRSDANGQITLLVGDLDEPEAMADRLALSRATPPAELARAALLRFGADTPALLFGEWTLLDWDPAGRLTLMASAARRDRVFFAVSGGRCAVAPDLARLARLAWVDDEIDPAGFLFGVGRADLRSRRGGRTMLRQVRQLAPAECVTIAAGGIRHEMATVLAPQPRRHGTFEDAVAEADLLLRRILRQRSARTAMPAILLSGGLDSSLLACLAAEERATGQPLELITSVAPAGSGLADERGFADVVAASLGLALNPVVPPLDADAYRPPDHIIAGAGGPFLSNRHCLTEAFQVAARARGATLLINGTYGEMSVTGRASGATVAQRLRAVARRMIRGRPPPVAPSDTGAFHVRLAPERLAHLPDEIDHAIATPPPLSPADPSGGTWGYLPGIEKALGQANEFYAGALRMDFPFRDVRLLRLFAGMPLSFFTRQGVDRAPARHMLDGHLPDSVRLRRTGMPASPDHIARLQRQAPQARARIAAFRRADVGEWLDLDWLDQALERIATHGPNDVGDANVVQLTAINAEVLTWWRTRR
ncbi:MAG: asparagine synthetase B family protein [Sphingomonas sp.]|uniref:asparagine synthase-related protein n=1 Tax=Sphingomonas sp. TaxID=28214 RepID=UPI001212A026|nr:asparagine synthetase B family protein [Sphingomonas sp.]THD35892.1 MAG: asparagine synthetase B family protein [Sphingomonas sp.]